MAQRTKALVEAGDEPAHVVAVSSPSPELDCLTCGACCRSGHDGRILVPAEDLLRWKKLGRLDLIAQLQPGHFGEQAFATTPSGACVHLGTKESENACQIYEDRGTTCREVERGSWQCLEFRREFGALPGSPSRPSGQRPKKTILP